MQVSRFWGHIGDVWMSPSPPLMPVAEAIELFAQDWCFWGSYNCFRNQAPSTITPAPGTLWSSWNGSWSLGCDESSGLTPAGACACSSGGIWGLILPHKDLLGAASPWGGTVEDSFPWESWVCAVFRWWGDEPWHRCGPCGLRGIWLLLEGIESVVELLQMAWPEGTEEHGMPRQGSLF